MQKTCVLPLRHTKRVVYCSIELERPYKGGVKSWKCPPGVSRRAQHPLRVCVMRAPSIGAMPLIARHSSRAHARDLLQQNKCPVVRRATARRSWARHADLSFRAYHPEPPRTTLVGVRHASIRIVSRVERTLICCGHRLPKNRCHQTTGLIALSTRQRTLLVVLSTYPVPTASS